MPVKAEMFYETVCFGKQGFHWENTQQALYRIYIVTGWGEKLHGCLLAVLC